MEVIAVTTSRERAILVRLYSTTLINCMSDAVAAVVLPLAFYARTGSVALAASLAAATSFSQLIFAVPLGALADRLPRRTIVITGYLCETLSFVVLAALVQTSPNWWLVAGLGCVRGCVSELGSAASAGYVTQVLGRDLLLRYHSRVETVEGIAAILGPPLAGAVVWLVGPSLGLLVPAGLSLFSGLVFILLPDVPVPVHATRRTRTGVAALIADALEGLAYCMRHRVLAAMVLVQFALGTTTASYVFGVVTHLRDVLGLPTHMVGIVMAASGVGGIVGSFIWERLVPLRRGLHLIVVAFISIAFLLAVFPWYPSVVGAAVILFVLDTAWVAVFIYAGSLEQFVSGDGMLARVSAVSGTAFLLASLLATALAARILPVLGPRAFMGAIAAACLPAIIAVGALIRRGLSPEQSGATDSTVMTTG